MSEPNPMIFTRNRAAEPAAPSHAFCEPVHATPTSPEHIREVGDEGLKLGGGVPNPALCGRDLRKGWDLSTPVTPDMVTRLAASREGDGRVFLCPACAEAYLSNHPTP